MYSPGDARVRVGPGLGLCVQPHGLIGEDTDSRTVGRQVRRVCKHDPICSAYKLMVGHHVAFLKLNLHWNETFMCWRLGLTHSQDLLLVRTLTGHSSHLVFPDTWTCSIKPVTHLRSLYCYFMFSCYLVSWQLQFRISGFLYFLFHFPCFLSGHLNSQLGLKPIKKYS